MRSVECRREQDVLDALASSRWPDRCDADLRAHVAGCRICADTLTVALPLLAEGEIAYASAHVPSSAVVWWRAQRRAREEAARAASRPITIVEGLGFACGATLVALAAVWALPSVRAWLTWPTQIAVSLDTISLPSLQALAPSGMVAWGVLALWLVLAPIAVYFALSSD